MADPDDDPALHLRAMTLASLGKPVLAFETLHATRDRFWGDITFVQVYHGLAYKVNREDEAHLAFLQLRDLQGDDDPDELGSLQLFSLATTVLTLGVSAK